MHSYRPDDFGVGDRECIQLDEGRFGCVNFDIAVVDKPHSDIEIELLSTGFQEEFFTKVNHRDRGRNYLYTLSRKCGRYVSKIGVPVRVSLGMPSIEVEIKLAFHRSESETNRYYFDLPLNLYLTATHPYSQISIITAENNFKPFPRTTENWFRYNSCLYVATFDPNGESPSAVQYGEIQTGHVDLCDWDAYGEKKVERINLYGFTELQRF